MNNLLPEEIPSYLDKAIELAMTYLPRLALALLTSAPRIMATPAPEVYLAEHGDSSVNFIVRGWVKSGDYWPVYFDMHENVKLTLDEKGISIPYPQRDVHLIKS